MSTRGVPGPGNAPNLVVGCHDAGSHNYSNLAQGVDFSVSGGDKILQVFENGTSRDTVGPSPGWTDGAIYRVRITIDTPNTKPNLNTERDRGGPKYASLGGGTWSNITPGMTSSSTTLLAAGPTIASHKQRPVSCKRLDGRYRHL